MKILQAKGSDNTLKHHIEIGRHSPETPSTAQENPQLGNLDVTRNGKPAGCTAVRSVGKGSRAVHE